MTGRVLGAAEAKALIEKFKDSITSSERFAQEMVEGQVWIGHGYKSLVEMWTPVMGDSEIHSPVVRMIIARQMLDEGAAQSTVTACVKGMGPETVRAAAAARSAGIPASAPKVALAAHASRPKGKKRDTVRIAFDVHETEVFVWERYMDEGDNLSDLARTMTRNGFSALAAQKNRR